MDFGTLIVGGILLSLCVVPLWLMARNGKKQERKRLQVFYDFVNQTGCKADIKECGERFVIGIDSTANKLLFYKWTPEKDHFNMYDLSLYSNCRVEKDLLVDPQDETHSVIQRVELLLLPEQKQSGRLLIYSAGENVYFRGELNLAERWAGTIRNQIDKHAKNFVTVSGSSSFAKSF